MCVTYWSWGTASHGPRPSCTSREWYHRGTWVFAAESQRNAQGGLPQPTREHRRKTPRVCRSTRGVYSCAEGPHSAVDGRHPGLLGIGRYRGLHRGERGIRETRSRLPTVPWWSLWHRLQGLFVIITGTLWDDRRSRYHHTICDIFPCRVNFRPNAGPCCFESKASSELRYFVLHPCVCIWHCCIRLASSI